MLSIFATHLPLYVDCRHPVALATQAIHATADDPLSLPAALQQLKSVVDSATADGPTALQVSCSSLCQARSAACMT